MLMKRRFEPLRSVTDRPNPLPHSGDREENREGIAMNQERIRKAAPETWSEARLPGASQ